MLFIKSIDRKGIIRDITGKEISNFSVLKLETEIDISKYKPGTYFISVLVGGDLHTEKLVIGK